MRIQLDPAQSFRDVVEELTRKFVLAEKYQYFQYDSVVDDLGLRDTALFPLSGLLFNMITFDISADELAGGPRRNWARVAGETRYGLMFYVMSHPECLSFELKHRCSLVDRVVAEQIVDTYVNLVRRLLEQGVDFRIDEVN